MIEYGKNLFVKVAVIYKAVVAMFQPKIASLWDAILSAFSLQLQSGITTDPYFQCHRTGQVKIRVAAEPTLVSLNGEVSLSSNKCRAVLPWPNAATRFWRREGFSPIAIRFTLV